MEKKPKKQLAHKNKITGCTAKQMERTLTKKATWPSVTSAKGALHICLGGERA